MTLITRSRFSYLVSRLHYSSRKSKQIQANRSIMVFTFEFLSLSYFVSFVFCFYSSDCFFFNCFKVVHSFLIFFFSVVGAIDIHVGHVRLLLIETSVKLWDAIIQRLVKSP